jgi:hypothetical protein
MFELNARFSRTKSVERAILEPPAGRAMKFLMRQTAEDVVPAGVFARKQQRDISLAISKLQNSGEIL